MRLTLQREGEVDLTTPGTLKIEGTNFICYTLEDRGQVKKVPGETRIPAGTYELRITWSPRFQKNLILLLNVPGFTGVRIHSGNNRFHTEGCILVGGTRPTPSTIGLSRWKTAQLQNRVAAALDRKERVWLDILDAPPATASSDEVVRNSSHPDDEPSSTTPPSSSPPGELGRSGPSLVEPHPSLGSGDRSP